MLDSKGVKILDKERDWRRRGINKLYMEKGGGPDPEQKRGGGGGGEGPPVLFVSHFGPSPRLRSSTFVR